MRKIVMVAVAALSLAGAAPAPVLSPGEIVAKAPAGDWVDIAVADLMVMDLAPDRDGPSTGSGSRRVVIQLMPPPFSQGWVGNVRKLAAAHWWDGTSINRVQDNYVVQWGDANGEVKAEAKPLPTGLAMVPESEYVVGDDGRLPRPTARVRDAYVFSAGFAGGFPVAVEAPVPDMTGGSWWPVHCYGMVGVGRDLPPDTGTGAELYTVIGHAPRHLDRNIALVGRVISGIELLSSLPRGTGALGVYEKAEQRVPIVSVRMAGELPEAGRPHFQYLSTDSATFARYADARANRRDPFFIKPAGGADICNIPVPVRKKP